MELGQFLHQSISCSKDVNMRIDSLFVRKEFNKGHQLLPVDNQSRLLFFIESGLGRSYYFKDQKDITHLFLGENKFYFPIHNIFNSTASPYAFELLEKSVVRIADYMEVEQHIDQSPSLQKFSRMLLAELLKESSDRLHSIQFQSARERYESLLISHPDILLKVSLGHIASYLGITQQTLSVIRSTVKSR
ncbi:CRP-like cAMP-binding protein [Chitinophaga dinghuensis]|uniref:CRP-like cAMP-binding protein n=1 Tax=Chitinophaga dinghuensis TaxID=1539050 RepID=A0A327VRW8_9BACT|nr:Crp/Fnr family transcriptional regulator [Chitinophaga dinghuensis]RAJ77286.1 CRP-like cAMP-binding protein [Chitinophaga dinghuensis]